jgi:hypothetical protein
MKKQNVLKTLIMVFLISAVMMPVISCMGLPSSAPPPPPGAPRPPTPAPPPAPLPPPLPAYDVTYTYGKPDNLAEALRDISDYLEDQGGYLLGDERQGEFIIGGQPEGFYRVTGDTVTISMNLASILTIKKEFGFYLDKPRDMSRAVQSLDTEIRKNNGTLTGTNLEQQGNFRASGVVGSYIVTNRVDVTITERPFYASEDRIEREVTEWFKRM